MGRREDAGRVVAEAVVGLFAAEVVVVVAVDVEEVGNTVAVVGVHGLVSNWNFAIQHLVDFHPWSAEWGPCC